MLIKSSSMEMTIRDMLMQLGTLVTTMAFGWALFQQYLPDQLRHLIRTNVSRYSHKLVYLFSPYQDITFDEYTGEFFDRSEVYSTIETYISETSSLMARRLKANFLQGKSLVLSMAEHEEVTDEFRGVKVWWNSNKNTTRSSTISIYPGSDEKRFYRLIFHSRHRDMITTSYLNHVLEEGKAIKIRKRTRKLYTNTQDEVRSYRRKNTMWCHIDFKHPARFATLAMEPTKKKRIVDDLLRFSKSKDYYERIGKAWKRGYLLYGPPGTGKSTMVAAIANLLEYDIYDLELTAVKDNVQLRRLLIETTSKSIILIEDIDCSLDLTGKRKKKSEKEEGEKEEDKDAVKIAMKDANKRKESEVTLSGLLNFIDGIWSACGEERIIIFTTNYVEKLDPALIRRGRMDMHIELAYCCFEGFKMLAENYLVLDNHPLFEAVEKLLAEVEMTPADVAEHLMPKSDDGDVDGCMESLVTALKEAKKKKEADKEKAEQEKEKEKEKEKVAEEVEEGTTKNIGLSNGH